MKIQEILEEQNQLNEGLSSIIKQLFKPGAEKLIYKLTTIGVSAVPIWNYLKDLSVYKYQLSTGKIDKDQYEMINRRQLTIMATEIASSLMVGGLLRTFAKFMSLVTFMNPTVRTILAGLTTYGQLEFMKHIDSDEWRQKIAWLLCGEIVDISPVVGGGIAKILDELTELVADIKNPGSTKPAAPSPSTQPDTTMKQTKLPPRSEEHTSELQSH